MRQPGLYLDNNATTPVDPRVLEAMRPFLEEAVGNASSRSHPHGWRAEAAVEQARKQVAALLGAEPREIVFTSGATESDNLALKGVAGVRDGAFLASPAEHPAVHDTLEHLAARGRHVAWLETDGAGRVDPAAVGSALAQARDGDAFALVAVMLANNEIGTVQPVREIGRRCEEAGAWFFTDATQGVGKVSFDVRADHVHLAAVTGHKIHGPQGAGALYVRRRDPEVTLAPLFHGGGQERGIRPGTLNVPGIVGLGRACELCRLEREQDAAHARRLRGRLWERFSTELDDVVLNGATLNGGPEHRLPGNLHVSFRGVDSQSLMMAVPEVSVSAGAACASGRIEPSRTLRACGIGGARAAGAIRFGIGRFTTEDEVERAADRFVAAVRKLRGKRL